MGEHNTELRIYGASAPQVLAALLRGLPPDADLVLDAVLKISANGRISYLHSLGTRADGVVCMAIDDGALPLVDLPPECIVYTHTSCSRGIDYESLNVIRGDQHLLGVSESPDGDLSVTVDGNEIVAIQAQWDSNGNRIAAPGTEITWSSLVERYLPELEVKLGPAAVVLHPGGPDHEPRPSQWVPQSDDDIPF